MKITKHLLLVALLVSTALGNLFAQTRNDLLLSQDLEDPNQNALMVQSLAWNNAWRDKGVLQLRVQQEGDAPGSFRKIVDFNTSGYPVRKETKEGDTWEFAYAKDGSLRSIACIKAHKPHSIQNFYYERNGDLRKSVLSWANDSKEIEGFYDKAGYLNRVRHSNKGITTKTINIQYVWDDSKQLVGMRTPDLNATYLYNDGRLVQYRAQELGKNTQVNMVYGEHGLTEMKKYEEKDGDLILLETSSTEYNAAGLVARLMFGDRWFATELVLLVPLVFVVFTGVAAALLAVERGARIVRVHDVRETVQALAVWRAMESGQVGAE